MWHHMGDIDFAGAWKTRQYNAVHVHRCLAAASHGAEADDGRAPGPWPRSGVALSMRFGMPSSKTRRDRTRALCRQSSRISGRKQGPHICSVGRANFVGTWRMSRAETRHKHLTSGPQSAFRAWALGWGRKPQGRDLLSACDIGAMSHPDMLHEPSHTISAWPDRGLPRSAGWRIVQSTTRRGQTAATHRALQVLGLERRPTPPRAATGPSQRLLPPHAYGRTMWGHISGYLDFSGYFFLWGWWKWLRNWGGYG